MYDQCTRLVPSFLSTVLWAYFWILNTPFKHPPFKQSFNAQACGAMLHHTLVYQESNLVISLICDLLTTALPVCQCLALNALHCTTLSSIYVFVCCDPRCSSQQRSMRRYWTTLWRWSTANIFCGFSSGQRLQQNSVRTQLPQHSAVAAASSFQTSTPTILGTLPVTICESERVFSKLQRTLTSIRSTMMEDRLEALLLRALFYTRRCAQHICYESEKTQLCLVAEIDWHKCCLLSFVLYSCT